MQFDAQTKPLCYFKLSAFSNAFFFAWIFYFKQENFNITATTIRPVHWFIMHVEYFGSLFEDVLCLDLLKYYYI